MLQDNKPLNRWPYIWIFGSGWWPTFNDFLCTISTEGAPILAFFARACPELAEGVGCDAASTM